MLRFIGLYGINSISFVANLSAIFFYSALAGPAGYGTYGIYVALMSIYLIAETSLLKSALAIAEKARAEYDEPTAQAMAGRFLRVALIPVAIGACLLIGAGNLAFPPDAQVAMGGSQIAMVVAVEHLLGYPANWLYFRLARDGRFNAIYALRLFSTLTRHAFAWLTLAVTGSIELAILAIVLKGAVLLAVSVYWLRRRFPKVPKVGRSGIVFGLRMFMAFMATAFVLLTIQEIPSVYVAHAFGRDFLGSYRFLYDIVAAVWFVATIYPTVLFSYLLPSRGQFDPQSTRERIRPLNDALLFFHLAYGNGVGTLLVLLAWAKMGPFTSQMSFALSLTSAVSLLGYSRFLIEATQALGRSGAAVIAVAASVAFLTFFFLVLPAASEPHWIGWGWLGGQLVLVSLLRLIIARATKDLTRALRDMAIIVVGFSILAIAKPLVSDPAIVLLGATLTLTCTGASLILIWQTYQSARRKSG